ncbi:sushi repeat-containing protein SRPX2-like [Diadema antillarum]|uniref:sushi repeat-containing protein SRPX2-like n=1 Tax=Diadema antillarum TaxID=105358 RepID=UPI003A84D79E
MPQPDVGAIECTGQVLGSVCTKVCPDRYGLLSGPSTVECLRNEDMGMWSNQLPDCVDDSPPILTPLPPSRRVFAEPLQTSVTVDWEPPRVEGETEEITVVHEAGPAPNSDLEEGVHWVSYYAEDSAGNVAKHTFNITVIVVRCPELEVTGNPRVDCSHGNLLGSSCSADLSSIFSKPGWDPRFLECPLRTGRDGGGEVGVLLFPSCPK